VQKEKYHSHETNSLPLDPGTDRTTKHLSFPCKPSHVASHRMLCHASRCGEEASLSMKRWLLQTNNLKVQASKPHAAGKGCEG